MKKRSRYLLLALGFIIFLIIAPLIVVYTSGKLFDFGDNQIVATGVLSVQTKPDDATIFLDGKERATSPASIRFLPPGEYTLRIEKSGYFPWEKRLELKEGKVTWAAVGLPEVHLLKHNGVSKTSPTTFTDAIYLRGNIAAVSGNSVHILSAESLAEEKTILLPAPAELLVETNNDQVVLAKSAKALFVVNTQSGTVTNFFNELSKADIIGFTNPDTILVLENSTIFAFSIRTKAKTVLLRKIKAANILGTDLYYIDDAGTLAVRQTNGAALLEPQTIKTELPKFVSLGLLATTERQLFILGDGTLYRLNDTLEQITSLVTKLHYSTARPTLLIQTTSELFSYNFNSSSTKLITRFSQPTLSPVIREDLGYAFFIQNNEIVALELDARDRQNRYQLMQIPAGKMLALDEDGKHIFTINQGILTSLEIK